MEHLNDKPAFQEAPKSEDKEQEVTIGDIEIEIPMEEEEQTEFFTEFEEDIDEDDHYRNLVKEIDDEVLNKLGQRVIQAVESDQEDRSDLMDDLNKGLDMLGLSINETSEPFEGACGAFHTLLIESAVKFQSKASTELLPTNGPARVNVLGDVTEEKEKQAMRVQKHLNWQIVEQMTEYYPDAERMLLHLPLTGTTFKKTYYDFHLERPVSEFIPIDQFVVPVNATDLYKAPRYTHILYKTKHELEADFASGLYVKPQDMTSPTEFKFSSFREKANEIQGLEINVTEDMEGYTLYEHYVDCYIEGIDEIEGDYEIASPYIITVDANSGQVYGVRRNWAPNDEKRKKEVNITTYLFVPGLGFYGLGFIQLLGNIQNTLTTTLRSLVDAGQFANLQGGFKLKGVKMVGSNEPIAPGEFKDIDAAMLDINKAIMPLPFKEPSNVLYQMLDFLDRKGQKFADSTEQIIADSTNYGPVGTTLALLDASTKFFSAIHKRLHMSQKHELKIISKINSRTLPDNYTYNLVNETMKVSRSDYDDRVDVSPSSDPNSSSNAHRMAKAQNLLEIALRAPSQHNMREVLKRVYLNMDYMNPEDILVPEEQVEPQDPLTDIKLAIEGNPIKAFEGQDHDSHIRVKQAFLSDPQSGGSSLMQLVVPVIEANIQEHLVLKFMEQMKATGQDDMATAAEQIAAQNQQLLEQQLQEQQNQDDAEKLKAEAAMTLAQSEIMGAQTQNDKVQFDKAYKTAEMELKAKQLELDILKEANRASEFDDKLANEIRKIKVTKGLEATTEALKGK